MFRILFGIKSSFFSSVTLLFKFASMFFSLSDKEINAALLLPVVDVFNFSSGILYLRLKVFKLLNLDS